MAATHPNPLLHHIRHLIGSVPAAAMTDSQLLERFLAHRDEAAIEVIVRRHGPLVFGVCRRVLHNAHAAEDAFQATFLILTRKAPSLVRHERLGSWLYKVAYRLALRARANEIRRQQCEAQAARSRPVPASQTPSPSDLVVALEEEVQRLPERHRAPLVLCYLEGKTNEEAAGVLGCPQGSMSARLAQARERLRECLTRRGFVAPAAGIAGLLATAAAEAAVPLPLLSSTVRAALWFASEEAGIASAASLQAVALARGAVRAMFLNKLKIAAAVLLVAALLGTGATMLVRAASEAQPAAPTAPPQLPEAGPARAEAADDRLPDGAVARMGSTRLRHGDAVFFAAYTPDGKGLVTAGRDRMVRLWDLATGKEIRRFAWGEGEQGDKPEPTEDGAAQKRLQQYWDDTARSCQAALSADGQIVAASRGGVVCLWDTASGKLLRQLQTGQKRLLQLAFTADGKSLLTLGPGQATAVWEVATGKCIRSTPGTPAPEFFAPIGLIEAHNALVSPGLKYLAFCGREESGAPWIQIRDLTTGKELPRIKASPGVLALAFSADDKTLVFENPEAGIVVADVATGKERRRMKSEGRNDSQTSEDSALALALSPDGKRLAVSWMSNTIELFDLASGKSTLPFGKVTSAEYDQHSTNWWNLLVRPALAFSPDGKKLVCSLGEATIRQIQADTGAAIPDPGTGHRAPVSALALSADGQTLWTYSLGDPARSWDWRTGKVTGQRGVPAGAAQAAFAADGRFACVAGHELSLCGADGKKATIPTGESLPESLALSPDGALLASRSFLRVEVHLWDATTLKERFTLGQGEDGPAGNGAVTETSGALPEDLVFSPDGRCLAAAGRNRQLCLWDVGRGTLFCELPLQAGQAIERFAFSPNGRVLATLQADRTVTLYEAVSGARRTCLGEADPTHRRVYFTDGSRSVADSVQRRRDAPVCLALSPDGRYLALAQELPEIHLWDVRAGREVGRLAGHEGGVVSLLFAPDGKHLLSGGTDTTVLTWDLTRLLHSEPAPAAELSAKALDALWTDLADKDATRAFDAIRKLSRSPQQAVALLGDRVRPATPADPQRLARLLADLGSDRFELRRQAQLDLEELGELAEPALRKALVGEPPLDLRQRLERLLDNLAGQVHLAGQLRDLRAVELLEGMGSAEARQLLQSLAGGMPEARLTREAKSAIQRLTKQTVTP
jgi:RNA polymerase sigma factor (sigma-70 family)